MPENKVIGARVPRLLYERARATLGMPEDARESDVIRAALIRLSGADPTDHPVNPWGGSKPGRLRRSATQETHT